MGAVTQGALSTVFAPDLFAKSSPFGCSIVRVFVSLLVATLTAGFAPAVRCDLVAVNAGFQCGHWSPMGG